MEPVEIEGDLVEIISPRHARVKAKSLPETWYAVALDDRGGKGSCTCVGFTVRRRCRHLSLVQRFAVGDAVPAAIEEGVMER